MCDPITILAVSTLISAGAGLASTLLAPKPDFSLPALPAPESEPEVLDLLPDPETVKEEARASAIEDQKKKTRTILTSPTGIKNAANVRRRILISGKEEEANTSKKTLLGG